MRIALIAFLLGCTAAIGGCTARSQVTAVGLLSTSDRAGNGPKIAQLAAQQCFDHSNNLGEFQDALKATGWRFTRKQRAEPSNPLALDAWAVPNVTVLLGQPLSNGARICSLLVEAPAAPSLRSMKSALSRLTGHEPGADGEWWWNRTATRKLHMTADGDGDRGQNLFINVEIYPLSWWQGLLG